MPLFSYISILYTSTSLYLYISEPLHFYISVSLCLYISVSSYFRPLYLYISVSLSLFKSKPPYILHLYTSFDHLYISASSYLYMSLGLHISLSLQEVCTSLYLYLYIYTSINLHIYISVFLYACMLHRPMYLQHLRCMGDIVLIAKCRCLVHSLQLHLHLQTAFAVHLLLIVNIRLIFVAECFMFFCLTAQATPVFRNYLWNLTSLCTGLAHRCRSKKR